MSSPPVKTYRRHQQQDKMQCRQLRSKTSHLCAQHRGHSRDVCQRLRALFYVNAMCRRFIAEIKHMGSDIPKPCAWNIQAEKLQKRVLPSIRRQLRTIILDENQLHKLSLVT